MALRTDTLARIQARGRRLVAAVAAATLTASVLTTLALAQATPAAADPAAPNHLVIAAVFGANSDTVRFTNDWVELYNPTDSPISLGSIDPSTTPATVTPNFDLCYRSYNAASMTACTSLVKLYGTVAPHHYYFVWYANAHSPADDGTYPTGVTPDLDFAVKTPANGNQAGSNMGGCNTGGQIELLDTSKGTKAITGDLSSAAAKAAGEVDGVGWMNASTNQPTAAESAGSSTVTGVNSGVNNTCVIARKFTGGVPVDTDANSSDFAPNTDLSSFVPHSQISDRVAVSPVGDAQLTTGEAIHPIQVSATAVYGNLSFVASGLPGGLSIDPATGVIDGTPGTSDAVGPYPVTVTVSDAVASDSTSVSFTLTVGKTLRVDPIPDVSDTKGVALPSVQVQAHGGTPGYTYAATGLPAGVTLDPTGVISGTPTDAVGKYAVHVSVTDSGTGTGAAAQQTVSIDFTLTEAPAHPAAGDPLAGLTINEVKATGSPANDWVELYDTGAAISGAAVDLTDNSGKIYHATGLTIASGGYAVVEGSALDTAGVDLTASDTLSLLEVGDQTQLDQTTWTAFQPTSWARTTDGVGAFAVSAYPTKGAANSGAPVIRPNDLLVTEVNYDNNSTDYYEYSEVTNTTNHPIDFSAYGLTLTKSGVAMTLHDPSDTSSTSPTVDPVIPAHGTQLFWWVETQYFGVKTTAQFLANYGLAASTPVVLVYGFSSLANSGGDHSFYLSVNQGSTLLSQAWVDTPCAANTLNGTSVCTATNGNYAEHYEVPADRTSAVAAVWYNSLHSGGDDINYVLKAPLKSPGTVDLEQLGYTRAVKITSVTSDAVTLHNTSAAPVDLSGYVLQKDSAGATDVLPSGTTVAAGADLVLGSKDSGLTFGNRDYATLLAPPGYAYSDGIGVADTTGPFLHTLAYDASSGQPPVIDPTTGLPLPPAGGLYRPAGVSALNGTVYASNTGDNLLAALANGSNTVVAGALTRYGFEPDQDGGAAADASLYQPGGTAVDAAGNVFIADSGDNVILEITKADGRIHLVAGTGKAGGAAASINAASKGTTVNLYRPESVAVAANGDLYIADTYDNRIVKVTAAGAATLVAGAGAGGYTGDGGAAAAATLMQPAGVAVDSRNNVYIADSANNVIRRVDAGTGVITTVAGNYAADQANNSCLGAYGGDGGPATSAQLNDPQGVAVDGAGDVFIADTFNNAVREVTPDGTISTAVNVGAGAGSEGGSPLGSGSVPTRTQLNTPYAVTVDAATNALYVADTRNSAIAQVVNLARAGNAAGPIEPADQIAVTGSGAAFAACDALTKPPVITEVLPATGLRTGDSTVTVIGSHFTGTTAVLFGAVPGTDVTVLNDSHLTVTDPAHAVGPVDITATNVAGASTVMPADQFVFTPVVPVVTAIAPATGYTAGGTMVTITGSHFTGTTGVAFGTAVGTNLVVADDSHLTVTSPAHAAGPVDVTLTNAEGASTSVPADQFTYLPAVPPVVPTAPVVSRVAPAAGLTTGGTTVTVTGSHFTGATGVLFGTVAGTKVVVTDDAHLRVTSPVHAAGAVDVTVTDAGGRSTPGAADRFTFVKPPPPPTCTYVADYARLARAQATLARDRKALAGDQAALKKARKAKTRTALRTKIAAVNRAIAADRRVVVAVQKAVTLDSGHSWCRGQVAAQATVNRAQARLAKDLKTRSGLQAALRKAHKARTKAELRTKIAVLDRTIAADRKALAAALKALRATR